MIGRTIGRFRITAELGSGGMATVWRAEDELLRRDVAIKILDRDLADSPEARRRFLREARSCAALDHPGVPMVFDYGESDGDTYMALTLVEGETLSARAARSPLAVEEAARIVADAALALSHAHACGVIHRDITGRNIMVARDGRVFLLDFGLALAIGDSRITSSHTVIGTLTYLAPEVVQNRPADALSDIYGLGVVLYEALTGTLPFCGERSETLISAILNSEPPSPRSRRPDVPPALERIVLRAMARDPAARHQSADELARDLATWMRPAPGPDPKVPATVPESSRAPVAPAEAGGWTARGMIHLAVLPFETAHPDAAVAERDRQLARGLSESLSVSLARLDGVRIIPPASASVAPPGGDPQYVARLLAANLVLHANVRRSGFDLRVSWMLIDPWRREQVEGGIVEGNDAALFRLEDDLAAGVRRALQCDERQPRASLWTTARDPAAHERYRQALRHLERRDNEASVNEAIALLDRLLQSEGDSARLHATLARAYLEKYEQTRSRTWEGKAAAACQRALELDPVAPETLVAAGGVHLAAGRAEEAIAEFEQAIERDPESAEALIGRARAQQAVGRLDEAEQSLRRAIALRPEDWRPFSYLGALYFNQGRYAEASGPFRRVALLTPDNPRAHFNLGSTLFQLDRLDEALAAMRHSIEIQPTAWAFKNLATVLFYLHRHAEAVDAYERAVAMTPTDAALWGDLGSARRSVPGQEERAVEALGRAVALMRERLERNPRDAESWASLAAWLANLRRDGEASAALARALELAPRDVNCMAVAGKVYHFIGDRTNALKWFREAVGNGFGAEGLRRDPELAPLLKDPEFVRILEEGQARTRASAGEHLDPGGAA